MPHLLRDARDITGAAPVPVPPPMPAVMNSNVRVASIAWRMRSNASSAPLAGLGFAPPSQPVVHAAGSGRARPNDAGLCACGVRA